MSESEPIDHPPCLITAVIVDHDQSNFAAQQLKQHRADHPGEFDATEWIVVSNGKTTPPSMANVRILSTANQGYGTAINDAVRLAKGRVVLAMNSDLVPEKGFLPAAIKVAERMIASEDSPSRVGIVGLRLVNADGTFQGSVGRFPTLTRFLTGLLRRRDIRKYVATDRPSGVTSVDWVTGACVLIDRTCFDQLGGFDEQFFLYYEDVDLCWRAHASGWRVEFDPSATCRHLFPYHARRLTVPMVYVARRSLLLYYWKHRPRAEFQVVSRIVRAECWYRRGHAGWRKVGEMVTALLRDPSRHVLDGNQFESIE